MFSNLGYIHELFGQTFNFLEGRDERMEKKVEIKLIQQKIPVNSVVVECIVITNLKLL